MIVDFLNSVFTANWPAYLSILIIFLTIEWFYFNKDSGKEIKEMGYYCYKIFCILTGVVVGLIASVAVLLIIAMSDIGLKTLKTFIINTPNIYFIYSIIGIFGLIVFIIINVQIRKYVDKRRRKNGNKKETRKN